MTTVYVVFKVMYDDEGTDFQFVNPQEDIVGVFTSELIAYKTGALKQLQLFVDDDSRNIEKWLKDNPFPESDNVDVYRDYFQLITSDDTIMELLNPGGFDLPIHTRVYFCEKEMNSLESIL